MAVGDDPFICICSDGFAGDTCNLTETGTLANTCCLQRFPLRVLLCIKLHLILSFSLSLSLSPSRFLLLSLSFLSSLFSLSFSPCLLVGDATPQGPAVPTPAGTMARVRPSVPPGEGTCLESTCAGASRASTEPTARSVSRGGAVTPPPVERKATVCQPPTD